MDNQLTIIDVSNLTLLTKFRCFDIELTCVNLKNGNNTNITDFNATGNPNLSCIELDKPTWSNTNWTPSNGSVSSGTSFSSNCNYVASCF